MEFERTSMQSRSEEKIFNGSLATFKINRNRKNCKLFRNIHVKVLTSHL